MYVNSHSFRFVSYRNANNTPQDFEGQRLSELLATVVLAVVGVRVFSRLAGDRFFLLIVLFT